MYKIAACVFALGFLHPVVAQEEDRWWDVCNPIQGDFGGGRLPDKASDDEAKVIKSLKFANWKQHDDQFVSFLYPDHPLIKLTINKAKKPFKVEGGVCSTVDNSYTQAYLLHVGKATYGVFLLTPAEWLDDGICLCGPMVHHAYKLRKGTLTRFSMLPGGAVKKAQTIGGGLRFMAFEWTHLACQKPIYEKMVASMRLKTSTPGGNKELRKKLLAHYGEDAELGLITRNAPAASLVKAFGKPTSKAANGLWTWKWIGEDYPTTLVANIKEGRVINYPGNGLERDQSNPVRGSLPWCENHIKMYPIPGRENETDNLDADDPFAGLMEDEEEEEKRQPPPKPTAEDKALCLTTITKTLNDEAGKNSDKWYLATNLAIEAAERELHLPKWSDIVIKHGTGQWYEIQFLEKIKSPHLVNWAVKILSGEIDITAEDSAISHSGFESLIDVIGQNSPTQLNELAPNLWASKHSHIRRLVFHTPEKLDTITVEEWIFAAIAEGREHDRGHLIYYAMDAVPKIKIQKKKQLMKALSKIPEGSKKSDWHETRAKALKYLQGDKPKD